MTERDKKRGLRERLELVLLLLMIVVCLAILWRIFGGRRPGPVSAAKLDPPPAAPIKLGDSPVKGNPHAPVTILEYSEFQCPYCAAFAATVLPAIERDFISKGTVKLVFKHLPLERIHPHAARAASASACAGHQAKFWEVHDFLFRHQQRLNELPQLLTESAIDVNVSELHRCLEIPTVDDVRRDVEQAAALGVRSTPTFFIGTDRNGSLDVSRRLSGVGTAEQFVDAVNDVLRSR